MSAFGAPAGLRALVPKFRKGTAGTKSGWMYPAIRRMNANKDVEHRRNTGILPMFIITYIPVCVNYLYLTKFNIVSTLIFTKC